MPMIASNLERRLMSFVPLVNTETFRQKLLCCLVISLCSGSMQCRLAMVIGQLGVNWAIEKQAYNLEMPLASGNLKTVA
jgi:hypothetical protein